jgi:hypothetical protein
MPRPVDFSTRELSTKDIAHKSFIKKISDARTSLLSSQGGVGRNKDYDGYTSSFISARMLRVALCLWHWNFAFDELLIWSCMYRSLMFCMVGGHDCEKALVMTCQVLPRSSEPQMEIRSVIPLSEHYAEMPSAVWADADL